MQKITKLVLCVLLVGVGFLGSSVLHKASAAELNTNSTIAAYFDPGTGVKPGQGGN